MNKSGVSIQESGVRIGAPRRSLLAKPGLCGKTLSLTFTIAAFAAFAVETLLSSTVAELRWPVEVSRPQSQEIPLFRGETIDLAVKVTQFAAPLDLTGATVVFHARTNAQPLNTSYQVTGTVGRAGLSTEATNGWATVRLIVDRDMPLASSMSYTYLISSTNGDLCRVNGTLKITGTAAGATSTAVASLVADPYGAAQAVGNSLASALQVETTRAQQAEAALSTSIQIPRDSARLIQPDTNAWITISSGSATISTVSASTNAVLVWTGPVSTDKYGNPVWGGDTNQFTISGDEWISDDGLVLFFDDRWHLTDGAIPPPPHTLALSPPGSSTLVGVAGPYGYSASWTGVVSGAFVTNAAPLATVPGTVLLLSDHNNDPASHQGIRDDLANKPSIEDVGNIIQTYAWPSMPQVDVGRSNAPVSLVLSNDVLYLYGS